VCISGSYSGSGATTVGYACPNASLAGSLYSIQSAGHTTQSPALHHGRFPRGCKRPQAIQHALCLLPGKRSSLRYPPACRVSAVRARRKVLHPSANRLICFILEHKAPSSTDMSVVHLWTTPGMVEDRTVPRHAAA